jgi:hypothetical protein
MVTDACKMDRQIGNRLLRVCGALNFPMCLIRVKISDTLSINVKNIFCYNKSFNPPPDSPAPALENPGSAIDPTCNSAGNKIMAAARTGAEITFKRLEISTRFQQLSSHFTRPDVDTTLPTSADVGRLPKFRMVVTKTRRGN